MFRESPIRVFLCDDVRSFRFLIRFVLEEDPDFTVVGEAADGRAGIDGVAQAQPDVVLLDLSMPVLGGLEALPLMLEAAPGAKVIGLSGSPADHGREAMLAHGAVAYLEKGTDFGEIARTVREVAAVAI